MAYGNKVRAVPEAPVIHLDEETTSAGNTVIRVGKMNPGDNGWHQIEHVVLTQDEREQLAAELTMTQQAMSTAETLTDAKSFGGAIAYQDDTCIVVYGVPCWIMPNGYVRVGQPNAPMVDVDHAVRTVTTIRDERMAARG